MGGWRRNPGCRAERGSAQGQGNSRPYETNGAVAYTGDRGYDTPMGKVKESEFENPAPVLDDEDEETLAAIDEGIRDADAGRTVPAEEVRKLLPQWITASSTCKTKINI